MGRSAADVAVYVDALLWGTLAGFVAIPLYRWLKRR